MKTLLILPPEENRRLIPRLGIMYISSFLKSNGLDVSILDCKALDFSFRDKNSYKIINNSIWCPIDWSRLEREISKIKPDIVGISAMTNDINNAHEVAKIVKRLNKKIPVIIGGVHATCMPKETLEEFPYFDILVRGEGEEIMAEIVETLERGRQIKDINGILFRSNGQILQTPVRSELKELDKLPFPDYDGVPLEIYTQFIKKTNYLDNIDATGFYLSSRGCPYHCTFCASIKVHGHKLRERSVGNVIQELKQYTKKYGTKMFWFWDDTLTVNKKRVLSLCEELIKEKLDLTISCYARVNTIDEELIRRMKQAGFRYIYYGIETGSEKVLKDIRKDITLSQAREAVKLSSKYGLYTTAGFMIGHPTDTKESIEQTIKFANDLIPLGLRLAAFWVAIPLPGTEMFEQVKNRLRTFNWPEYFYQDCNMPQAKPVFAPEGIGYTELIEYQRRAYREFRYEFVKNKILSFDILYILGVLGRRIKRVWNNLFIS